MQIYSFIISHHTVCHHLSIITDCNSIHDSPGNYSNGNLWMLPLSIFALMITSWGFGLIFASANVVFPDLAHLFRFITKAGFFVSPVTWTEMLVVRAGDTFT